MSSAKSAKKHSHKNKSSKAKTQPSICLNMIVKNEAPVIERCLASVKDLINYWVICDTGSTDGTQEVIRNYFAKQHVPGELYEDAWQDFAYNRNLALDRARDKADYILIIDADDFLDKADDFRFENLTADEYLLKMVLNEIEYYNTKLIKTSKNWRWEGVLHEYLTCDKSQPSVAYQGNYAMRATREGNRSHNPDKYKRDIEVLEKAIVDEPNNTRYRFYLAQSYRDDGNNEKALEHYQKRVDMGGWAEEVYYSLLQIGHCKERLKQPLFDVIDAYLKAHHYRPSRLEALCSAIRLCRIEGKHYLGYHLGRHITDNPSLPEDILFVEKAVYDWLLLDEISLCAVYAGQPQLAAQLMKRLLELSTTPTTEQARLGNNLRFALAEAM